MPSGPGSLCHMSPDIQADATFVVTLFFGIILSNRHKRSLKLVKKKYQKMLMIIHEQQDSYTGLVYVIFVSLSLL